MAGARQQPQGVARLARGNPLAITDLWLGSSALTLVKGYVTQPTSSSSGITGAGPGGRYVRGDGSSLAAGYQISDNSNNLLGAVGTTWAIVRRCRDTVVRPIYMHYGYDLGANNRCLLGAPEDGNITWDFGNATAGSGRLQAPYVKDTLLETLVVVAGQVKGREIWRRGVKLAGNPAAKALRVMDAAPFGIGRVGGNTASDDVETYMVVVSNKEWSDAEIRNWCANPWAVVEGPSTHMAFTVPTGGTAIAAWAESPEGFAAAMTAQVASAAAWAEAPEGVSAAVTARVNAAADWTEAAESTTVTASALVSGAATWAEARESNNAVATALVNVGAAWTEAPETSALQGTVGNDATANAAWTEAREGTAITAAALVSGAAAWSEVREGNAAQAVVGNAATLAVSWAEAREGNGAAVAARVTVAAGWTEAPEGFISRITNGDESTDIDAGLIPKSRVAVFPACVRIAAFPATRRIAVFKSTNRIVRFQ